MSHDEREILNAKIAEILSQALVMIRSYTNSPVPGENEAKREETNDLADLLHNMPRYIVGHDENAIDSMEQFRASLVDHVVRFYPNTKPENHRYVVVLDMDPDVFLSRFKRHQLLNNQPAIA